MNYLLDMLGQSPRIWNALRRLAEDQFRGEHTVIAQELTPWRSVGQRRFLDLGCGTGELASCFPPSAYVGIDYSRTYIHFAAHHTSRTTPGRRFAVMDATALGFGEASFDAALVLGVLHHLPDNHARAALHELERVIRPGGILLIMEDIPPPDVWNIGGHLLHLVDRGGYIRTKTHYQALVGAGFAVARTYHMRSGICDYGVFVLRRLDSPS